MKKEMKYALVALGLSTLLVPTFANQVVYAQEESHETTTSVSPEEVRKKIEETKNDLQNFKEQVKHRLFEQIDKEKWDTISFSQNDVDSIKNEIQEVLNNNLRSFIENLEEKGNSDMGNPRFLEYFLASIPESATRFKESHSERSFEIDRRLKYSITKIAILKKRDILISQIKKNPYYTSSESEEMISRVSYFYGNSHGSGIDISNDKYLSLDNNKDDINAYIKKVALFLSNNHHSISITPTEKNIREINAVAFMEKTAISNDDTLSKSDKISMFSKIDDIVEEAVRKIKTEAYIREDGNYKNSRMLSPEELSVFTKRIEDVYQGKAKPKVTKEEAIQAVSTGTSTSASTSSQVTVTAVGETKKNHQVSNWFKESGKWYYNDLSGNLVRNRWVGRYYLKADASMAASEWIYDEDYKSWFYVDSTGSYVEKAWQGEYYLKRGGYMAKSEWVFDSQYDSWYYLNQDGKYARNQWIKDGDKWYYLLADGKLAKNMTINGYKVNEKGEWV